MAISKIKSAGITADFDNTLTTADLAPNSVDSSELVDGSVDLSHMSANSIDSDQYVDGSIDLVHMSANSVDSDQYVDGSIDNVHIADDAVSTGELANNVVINTSGAITTTSTMTSVDIDMTGLLAGTSGSMDIKNEANNENLYLKTTSSSSEVTAIKIHSDGTVELGTGVGLRVGGTAAVNTLDDYEEGTWTPLLSSSGGVSGQSYDTGVGNTQGKYTKVGNKVTVWFHVDLNTKGTMSGSYVYLAGLPFTTSAFNEGATLSIGMYAALAENWTHVNGGYGGGTFFYVLGTGIADVGTQPDWMAPSAIGNNTNMRGTASYMVA